MPWARRASSMPPSAARAWFSMAGWADVSSRSSTQTVAAWAPRVTRSSRTAASLPALRPTRKKLAPCSASRRSVASAMAEVAPSARMRCGSGFLAIDGPPSGDALPEGGIEAGVDVAGEVLPLRIEGLKLLRGHAGVFGGVHAATVCHGDLREAVDQIEANLFADGEVECEHDARRGEGHHADGGHVAEKLDDGEERGQAGAGDFLQDGEHAFAAGGVRQHVLELEQAVAAVHAVPAEHGIERVEEGLVVDGADFRVAHLLMEVERVESGHRETVQLELGQ